jgi:asparagine synthetase B (glutamine-hydrolysing)
MQTKIIMLFNLNLGCFSQEMAGDDHALNFGSAFADFAKLVVAEHALHGIIADIAVAAVELEALPGRGHSQLSDFELAHTHFLDRVHAPIGIDINSETPEEIAERLLEELRTAVRYRKVADVPVGVFLSGGIDSSTNAALFSEGEGGPVGPPSSLMERR